MIATAVPRASAVPSIDWGRLIALLPKPALRRSWFARDVPVEEGDDFTYFVDLLRELDPDLALAMRGHDAIDHYIALVRWCETRFPMNADYALLELEEGGVTPYIPVEPLGFYMYEAEIRSPSIAVCLVAAHQSSQAYDYERSGDPVTPAHFECLKRFLRRLPDLSARKIEHAPQAPAGRTWKRPWDGLGDLFDWANSQTGYGELDVFDVELDGYSYPMWNAGEIRSLATQWQHARPVFERARALAIYIDQKPRERLPLLANALTGDAVALKQITAPKSKRLAKVWK